MKVTSTKDSKQHGVKILVYGASGAGKTKLIATAPNPIIISSENGLLTLSEVDLPVVEVKTEDDLERAYKYVTTNNFDTICLDSLSDIAEAILSEQQGKTKDGRQAYGELGKIMAKYIRKFRDIKGKHVYFTAKEAKLEVNNVVTAQPSMPGQMLAVNTPYFFDEVLRLEANRKGERVLHTQASFTQIAKDRSDKLEKTEPADLSAIFKKITGESK